MTLTLGFDPDLHHAAWALASTDGVYACGTITAPTKLKGAQAVVAMIGNMTEASALFSSMRDHAPRRLIVEGMHTKNRDVPAEGLFHLCEVGGAFAMLCKLAIPELQIFFPPAAGRGAWKYAVPKKIHNERILHRYGLTVEHVAEMASCSISHTNHVIDAIGLARYGAFGLKQQ